MLNENTEEYTHIEKYICIHIKKKLERINRFKKWTNGDDKKKTEER